MVTTQRLRPNSFRPLRPTPDGRGDRDLTTGSGSPAIQGRPLVVLACAGYALLWLLFRDPSVSWSNQLGELAGAQGVLFLTISAVLAVGSTRVDQAFGGTLTRQRWHRGSALVGLAFVIVHVVVVLTGTGSEFGRILGVISMLMLITLMTLALLNPRGWAASRRGPIGWIARMPYDPWKIVHRATAVSLLAAMVHGYLSSVALVQPVLAVTYLGISIIGTAALAYQLLLRRHVLRGAPYLIEDVDESGPDVRTITLRPTGRRWNPLPGQYIEAQFAGVQHGTHPFTVIGVDAEGRLQIAVKAVGNDTAALHRNATIGSLAWVHRPRGDFSPSRAGRRQIWIAGGIGITPFLSWIRSLPADHDAAVDLWYSASSPSQAVFLDELTAAADRFRWLTLHVVTTNSQGHLTAGRILAESSCGSDASAHLCGPPAMIETLSRDLLSMGLTGPVVHEAFSPR